mmetsp:Transcript_31894/g.74555  ORF Transcript_31894/g.74555 Transcript_31894/m.74555 type:complete len:273 (+) Transcript_31894:103-921(+)
MPSAIAVAWLKSSLISLCSSCARASTSFLALEPFACLLSTAMRALSLRRSLTDVLCVFLASFFASDDDSRSAASSLALTLLAPPAAPPPPAFLPLSAADACLSAFSAALMRGAFFSSSFLTLCSASLYSFMSELLSGVLRELLDGAADFPPAHLEKKLFLFSCSASLAMLLEILLMPLWYIFLISAFKFASLPLSHECVFSQLWFSPPSSDDPPSLPECASQSSLFDSDGVSHSCWLSSREVPCLSDEGMMLFRSESYVLSPPLSDEVSNFS